MSASAMYHGPFTASARRVEPREFASKPFVSVDITVPGASATLINLSPDDLDSLEAAIVSARALLPVPAATS